MLHKTAEEEGRRRKTARERGGKERRKKNHAISHTLKPGYYSVGLEALGDWRMDCAISTQHLAFHIEENIKRSRSGMMTMCQDVLTAIRTMAVPFFFFFFLRG